MGKTTDELLALAKQVSASPARRELDMLLTAGRAHLHGAALDGAPGAGRPGHQLHRAVKRASSPTTRTPRRASSRCGRCASARSSDRGKVVIVAGFQGVSPRKEVTTLGRGRLRHHRGGAGRGAGRRLRDLLRRGRRLHRRPARGPRAPRRLDEISYEEMQELARAGAKVLNAQAVEFAREKGIAIHARATFGVDGGDRGRGRAAPGGADRRGGRRRRSWRWWSVPWGGLGAALGALERRGAAPAEVAGRTAGGRWRWSRSTTSTSWPAARGELLAAVPDAAVDDDGTRRSVSVVGGGAAGRARRWWRRWPGWGVRARWRSEAGATEVTAYAEADAAREVHRGCG